MKRIVALILGFTALLGGAPAHAGLCQSVALPAYFYPVAGGPWEQIRKSAVAYMRTGVMILNPASGPGAAVDPTYVTTVKSAQSVGVKVIGYVSTAYGARPAATLKAEIDKYKQWYGVDGVFFDEMMGDSAHLSYYSSLIQYVRASRGGYVMTNPGVFPQMSRYILLADATIVFEGSYASYTTAWPAPPSWVKNYPASKFVHLIYAAPAANLSNALALSRTRNAGQVFVTDDVLANPWDTLPAYWSSELSALTAACAAP